MSPKFAVAKLAISYHNNLAYSGSDHRLLAKQNMPLWEFNVMHYNIKQSTWLLACHIINNTQ